MIHFDFEDRYQDELLVGSAISRREGTLLSIGLHAAVVLFILFGGRLAFLQPSPEELERRRQEVLQQQLEQERNRQRFVFVQPRLDTPAPTPPPRPELSDLDRRAAAPEVSPQPNNPLPLARGNSAERTEASVAERARGEETPPTPEPPAPEQPKQEVRLPEADRGLRRPIEMPKAATGSLGKALRNLQEYVQNQTFNNPQGGTKDPGQAIQFDTKGVDFGPWVRRFVQKVKRNWFVPEAAFSFHGRVVLQFNIHRDGHITDLIVAQPSNVDAFNRAAFNAILGSNPVEPLPPEYPDDKAFFTVTFYYNESPVN
ncbi:MAG TPA: TonB family protein [Vicinamibacterales bacterium]|nr:TonB family protein [Vicinamibacterales bacterium]